MAIYLSSDYHFGHDRDFVYGPRGCSSMLEMNDKILKNHNSIITDEDEVWLLGDIVMGNQSAGLELLRELKGNIHIVRGNHDTDNKLLAYQTLPNVQEVTECKFLKFKKWLFILSHYPTLVGNYEDPKPVYNIHGHTHSKEIFQFPDAYNVNPEAHDCMPKELSTIKAEIIARRQSF